MENIKADKHIGDYLHRVLRIKVMELLWKERVARGLTLEDIAAYTGVELKYLKKVECNFRNMNWFSVAIMLKYFHKRIVLSLDELGDDNRDLVITRRG